MKIQRGAGYFLGVIFLVVFPSALSLSLYYVSKDPTIRPLGITEQSLAAYRAGNHTIELLAIVDWDQGRRGLVTPVDMERALRKAFEAKGVEARIVFRNSAHGTHVTYQVGPSIIGPYPQSRAAEGIGAAVQAYRMSVPFEP